MGLYGSKIINATVIGAVVFGYATAPHAQATKAQPTEAVEIELFATPDESSAVAASVKSGETLSPMAETIAAGGSKWFLVQTKGGAVGWIRAGDSDRSKKIETFFKSLPNEPIRLSPTEFGSAGSATRSRGAVTVPVDARGSQVIVPVTFNRNVTAHLLLDTGAQRTMISSRIARDLRLYSFAAGRFAGIGGSVTASVARVESVQVGDLEVSDLVVAVHDFSRHPRIEGLLGMDFLNHFHIAIDARKQRLVLTPR